MNTCERKVLEIYFGVFLWIVERRCGPGQAIQDCAAMKAAPSARLDADRAEERAIREAAAVTLERKVKWSLMLTVAMATAGGVEFSVVIPSLWKYIGRLTEGTEYNPVNILIYSNMIFTLSHVIVKPVSGYLSDLNYLSFRRLYQISNFAGASGGILYCLAGPLGGVPVLLIARSVMGIANAASTLANAYAVRMISDTSLQRQQLALVGASTLVGVFTGPLVVPIFSYVHVDLGAVALDECTLPGAFLACLFLIFSILVPSLEEPEPRGLAEAASRPSDAHEATDRPWSLACVYSITFLFSVGLYSVTSVLAKLTEENYSWGPVQNAYLFLFLSLFTLCGLLAARLAFAKTSVTPTQLIIAGTLLMCFNMASVAVRGSILDKAPTFLAWGATLAAGYALVNGANGAAVSQASSVHRTGYHLGLMGFYDSAGNSLGPAFLKLFGVEEPGARTADVLVVSRGWLTLPSLVLLAIFLVQEFASWLHSSTSRNSLT
jgi:MFS family permease